MARLVVEHFAGVAIRALDEELKEERLEQELVV
jgi:hypothetical protein